MNFNEWCLQTSKELGTGYTRELVMKVILMAVRVALEEFRTNPVDADLNLLNLGRFYFNRRKFHFNADCVTLRTGRTYNRSEDVSYAWTINFKPYRKIKDIINNKAPMTEANISGYLLYPEYADPSYFEIKHFSALRNNEIRHPNEYWIKKINLMKKGVLDFVNNEWVKTGFTEEDYEKSEIDKKRGRPRKKMTATQIRNAVMTEIARDYKREVRQLRKKEIKEKDLKYPWYSSPRKRTKKFQQELVRQFFPNGGKTVKCSEFWGNATRFEEEIEEIEETENENPDLGDDDGECIWN